MTNAPPAQLADLLLQLARATAATAGPILLPHSLGAATCESPLCEPLRFRPEWHHGPYAWRHLIAALDDSDPAVQLAAVKALRKSSTADAARFVHALFHRDPKVRQAAITGLPPDSAAAHYLTYGFWKTVLDLCAAGRLTRSQARHLLLQMDQHGRLLAVRGHHSQSERPLSTSSGMREWTKKKRGWQRSLVLQTVL